MESRVGANRRGNEGLSVAAMSGRYMAPRQFVRTVRETIRFLQFAGAIAPGDRMRRLSIHNTCRALLARPMEGAVYWGPPKQ